MNLLHINHFVPEILIVGFITVISFYIGKSCKWVKLPSIIGFMLVGVIIGPSFLNILDENAKTSLSFITDVALSFVAVVIGLELSLQSLKRQGRGMVTIIFTESFGAFFMVLMVVYAITRDLPLSLLFAAIAPASAPAGTVAVIKEYRASGRLTNALYTVVGFDDALGIMIFGFAAAFARSILFSQSGGGSGMTFAMWVIPFLEIIFSVGLGLVVGFVFCVLARKIKNDRDVFILIIGFALINTGICSVFHLSLILTNMVTGMFIVNTQSRGFTTSLGESLSDIMPILFILFFTIAGANLHVATLSSLGLLGIGYIIARTMGLMGGARLGAMIGHSDNNIKKYHGMGILSQAGVAIGLALIVKQDFAGVGAVVSSVNGVVTTAGDMIGSIVISTVTVTCIFFELIGPILTKIALTRAGEIPPTAS